MRALSNKTHRAEHEIYSFCAKERDLGNIGQMRKSKRRRWRGGGNSSQLLCLKCNRLTNFENTVHLSYVHTRGVGFLNGWREAGGEEGQQFGKKKNFRIRENGKNVGHNIFLNTRPNEWPSRCCEALWCASCLNISYTAPLGWAYKCLCYCFVTHTVSVPNECE